MNITQRNTVLGLALIILSSSVAHANIVLGFNTVAQSTDSIDVELVISGLGVGVAPSLASYDLDVVFDDSHLAYSHATFGDPILGNQLDLFDFGLNSSAAAVNPSAALNIFEVSFDDSSDLNAFQADTFTLATLSFDLLKTGSSDLSYIVNDLGDAGNNLLVADLTTSTVSNVPIPGAFWLMATGLAMLSRKKVARN